MTVKDVHDRAMFAKEAVFRAQDALSLAWNEVSEIPKGPSSSVRHKLLIKIEKRLARVRRELEELDNDVRRVPGARGEDR